MEATPLIPREDISDVVVAALADAATTFLLNQTWCRSVTSTLLAYAVPGVIGIFLLHIVPARSGIDETLWVVVGDIPPAYLVCDDAPTWREALESYIYEMDGWVAAVRSGDTLEDVIPVKAAPTASTPKCSLVGLASFAMKSSIGRARLPAVIPNYRLERP
jgi:hypothetical protein